MGIADRRPGALLRGSDHPDLGAVAATEVGDDLAVGLTRGREPKAYGYLDPNEDVAAAVAGPGADLLVVADGHNGAVASEVAVDVVLERLGDDPPAPGLADRDLVELFWEVNEAVRKATEGLDGPQAASRTTLTVCLVDDARVQWGSMGDSPVVVVDAGGGRELTRQRHQFLGDMVSVLEIAGQMTWGAAGLEQPAWVLALTDGFSNFAIPRGRPGTAAADALAGLRGPIPAVQALIARAGEGGAGDNVAVALRAPRT